MLCGHNLLPEAPGSLVAGLESPRRATKPLGAVEGQSWGQGLILVQVLTDLQPAAHSPPPGRHMVVVGAAHHFHEKNRENDGQTSARTVLPIIFTCNLMK